MIYETQLNIAKLPTCPRETKNKKLAKSFLKTRSNNKACPKSSEMDLNAN
jgi:hypothetical protein